MNDENLSLASNLPLGFDEKPIGHKLKFQIPQYAQNENPAMLPEVAPLQKLPLLKRLQSMALKNKKEALQELLIIVKDSPREFKQYQDLIPDLLSFAHASVVDRTLKIILLYFQGGEQLALDPKIVIKTVLEKCLASDKAEKEDIRKSSEQVMYWYMDNRQQDCLLNELNDALLNKNPKIIATALLFIANLLNNYGIKRMKALERFSKHLQLLASPPKPMAKAQTIELFKEVFRWMGDSCFKEFKMHMEVKEEIVKFSKDYQRVSLEIKRGVRRQFGDKKVLYNTMEAEESQNQEEVDVLNGYGSRWVDQVLEIPKWKDKKAALDEFIKRTRVNNILPPKDVSHYITLAKRLLAQNNINLLLCGFLIIQNLSKGLKKNFANVSKNISPFIFLKLKDAKPNIVEAAQTTLRSLLYSITLEDLLEEIKESLEDKAPLMRVQTLKFLASFAGKKEPKIMNIQRSLVEKVTKLTEDGAEVVRKQALELLCSLKKAHGMKYFGDKLKSLDSKKISIIQLSKSMEPEMMDIQLSSHPQFATAFVGTYQLTKMQVEQKIEQPVFKESIKPNLVKSKQQQGSIQSSVQSKPIKSVSSKVITDLSSTNESIRYNAYLDIHTKSSFQDLKSLMFIIKSNTIRESSPNNLKLILQIVKKYCGLDPIDMETLEFVYKHDWKKAKLILQDFHNNNKFTTEASDYIRHNNIAVSNSKAATTPQGVIQQTTIKSFMKELDYLLSKMTNPILELRKEAADHAIKFLQSLGTVANETDLTPTNGWNQEVINKFCGIAKFRLNECDQVASIYAELLKLMIHKGVLSRNKGIKPVIQAVMLKLREKKPFIRQIFQEIANSNPQHIYSMILGELTREVNPELVEFIIANNELFIRNAELKAYICPFVNLIFNTNSDLSPELKEKLEKILDQIVELNGEAVLEKEMKQMKINNPILDQYLAKYNISLASPALAPKNINIKAERLKIVEDNPWPICATPAHVLKLINQLISMKDPFPILATPLCLTEQLLERILAFDNTFLADNSDLLLKWFYWRTVIDPQEMMGALLKFTLKIVMAVGSEISQSEFSVLLSAMINLLERFKLDYLQSIVEILNCIFSIDYLFLENSLLFWANSIFQSRYRIPVGQILRLITTLYSTQAIFSHLPALSRSPEALKNEQFLRFLSANYDHQVITAMGFRVIGVQKSNKLGVELKPLLSDLGGPENMISITAEEKRSFVSLFQRCSSIELETKIKQINKGSEGTPIDTHMKILYSIVVPFMKKEIPIINVFTYLREFVKLFNSQEGTRFSHCLKDLTRMLLYFLIDLDENSIQNKDQITKSVNRIILIVLEKSDSRHMLEVLVMLLQYQLRINLNSNSKIQHLIYKCIGKVVKFPKFEERWRENLLYIITETNSIFSQYQVKIEHPLIKTIRAIWKNDILINSSFFNFVDKHLKTQNINSTLLQVFTEVINSDAPPLGGEEGHKDTRERADHSSIKGLGPTVTKLVQMKKEDNT